VREQLHLAGEHPLLRLGEGEQEHLDVLETAIVGGLLRDRALCEEPQADDVALRREGDDVHEVAVVEPEVVLDDPSVGELDCLRADLEPGEARQERRPRQRAPGRWVTEA